MNEMIMVSHSLNNNTRTGLFVSLCLNINPWSVCSGGSRRGHKVSGTRSKLPNLNENGQERHFSLGFSDSEPGQNFV